MELDFSGLACGSCIVTPLPSLKQAVRSSEKTLRTQKCFINATASQHPYRASVGQEAPRGQAINKSGFIMKPNESPSIILKHAGDLKTLQEEETLPPLESKPYDEQIAMILNTRHHKKNKLFNGMEV